MNIDRSREQMHHHAFDDEHPIESIHENTSHYISDN